MTLFSNLINELACFGSTEIGFPHMAEQLLVYFGGLHFESCHQRYSDDYIDKNKDDKRSWMAHQ